MGHGILMTLVHLAFLLAILGGSAFLFARLRNPFWAKQPVHHHWDMHLWLSSGRIICDGPALSNSYVYPLSVSTERSTVLGPEAKDAVSAFISQNYLRAENAKYVPTTEDVFDYLQSEASLISTWKDGNIKGVITSRPLQASLPVVGKLDVGYVDNLTVHKDSRKKGIAPRLIQTYLYQAREFNPDTKVYLFKREGPTNPTVPLVKYDAEFYKSSALKPILVKGAEIASENDMATVLERVRSDVERHSVAVVMSDPDILRLVKAKKIYILKTSSIDGSIKNVMFVRKSPTYDSAGVLTLEIIYLVGESCSRAQFITLVSGLVLIEPVFNLSIERIGSLALPQYVMGVDPYAKCPMAYFFYNYACPTQKARQVGVLV
jgi:GNAT superfamily N-acetyltransferase